ncbi:MAG: SDR family NAD(P)-dependent oxidoreductase, partial [Deltaproteobacteria bacterium]|nr:SDR family NAD(P)-dependent oxidoreductase [Deltaproteobacteria bacterium]
EAGRRENLLQTLKEEIPSRVYIKKMDVSRIEEAERGIEELLKEMADVDVIVINSGVGISNRDFRTETEIETIMVNVAGFAAMAMAAARYFKERGKGQIVGVTSVAGIRGHSHAPAYNASKAFGINYLEGLRRKLRKTGIVVTDIRPGFVDTPMTKGRKDMFWVAPARRAAEEMFEAIRRKKKNAYITKRWGVVALCLRMAPDWLYNRI